ncbi:hypothetical protein [Bradyrhizobium genosp. P]|uniref:hypothetical protein n=1 Tax=Bradyrhizobium genosp. P TaxID=83641 RepID=UPI003CEB95D2
MAKRLARASHSNVKTRSQPEHRSIGAMAGLHLSLALIVSNVLCASALLECTPFVREREGTISLGARPAPGDNVQTWLYI